MSKSPGANVAGANVAHVKPMVQQPVVRQATGHNFVIGKVASLGTPAIAQPGTSPNPPKMMQKMKVIYQGKEVDAFVPYIPGKSNTTSTRPSLVTPTVRLSAPQSLILRGASPVPKLDAAVGPKSIISAVRLPLKTNTGQSTRPYKLQYTFIPSSTSSSSVKTVPLVNPDGSAQTLLHTLVKNPSFPLTSQSNAPELPNVVTSIMTTTQSPCVTSPSPEPENSLRIDSVYSLVEQEKEGHEPTVQGESVDVHADDHHTSLPPRPRRDHSPDSSIQPIVISPIDEDVSQSNSEESGEVTTSNASSVGGVHNRFSHSTVSSESNSQVGSITINAMDGQAGPVTMNALGGTDSQVGHITMNAMDVPNSQVGLITMNALGGGIVHSYLKDGVLNIAPLDPPSPERSTSPSQAGVLSISPIDPPTPGRSTSPSQAGVLSIAPIDPPSPERSTYLSQAGVLSTAPIDPPSPGRSTSPNQAGVLSITPIDPPSPGRSTSPNQAGVLSIAPIDTGSPRRSTSPSQLDSVSRSPSPPQDGVLSIAPMDPPSPERSTSPPQLDSIPVGRDNTDSGMPQLDPVDGGSTGGSSPEYEVLAEWDMEDMEEEAVVQTERSAENEEAEEAIEVTEVNDHQRTAERDASEERKISDVIDVEKVPDELDVGEEQTTNHEGVHASMDSLGRIPIPSSVSDSLACPAVRSLLNEFPAQTRTSAITNVVYSNGSTSNGCISSSKHSTPPGTQPTARRRIPIGPLSVMRRKYKRHLDVSPTREELISNQEIPPKHLKLPARKPQDRPLLQEELRKPVIRSILSEEKTPIMKPLLQENNQELPPPTPKQHRLVFFGKKDIQLFQSTSVVLRRLDMRRIIKDQKSHEETDTPLTPGRLLGCLRTKKLSVDLRKYERWYQGQLNEDVISTTRKKVFMTHSTVRVKRKKRTAAAPIKKGIRSIHKITADRFIQTKLNPSILATSSRSAESQFAPPILATSSHSTNPSLTPSSQVTSSRSAQPKPSLAILATSHSAEPNPTPSSQAISSSSAQSKSTTTSLASPTRLIQTKLTPAGIVEIRPSFLPQPNPHGSSQKSILVPPSTTQSAPSSRIPSGRYLFVKTNRGNFLAPIEGNASLLENKSSPQMPLIKNCVPVVGPPGSQPSLGTSRLPSQVSIRPSSLSIRPSLASTLRVVSPLVSVSGSAVSSMSTINVGQSPAVVNSSASMPKSSSQMKPTLLSSLPTAPLASASQSVLCASPAVVSALQTTPGVIQSIVQRTQGTALTTLTTGTRVIPLQSSVTPPPTVAAMLKQRSALTSASGVSIASHSSSPSPQTVTSAVISTSVVSSSSGALTETNDDVEIVSSKKGKLNVDTEYLPFLKIKQEPVDPYFSRVSSASTVTVSASVSRPAAPRSAIVRPVDSSTAAPRLATFRLPNSSLFTLPITQAVVPEVRVGSQGTIARARIPVQPQPGSKTLFVVPSGQGKVRLLSQPPGEPPRKVQIVASTGQVLPAGASIPSVGVAVEKRRLPVITVEKSRGPETVAVEKRRLPASAKAPAQPVPKVVLPLTKSVQSVSESVQPVTKSAQPVTKPVQPVTKSVQPVSKSVQPVTKPVQPVTKPVQSVTKSVQPPTGQAQVVLDRQGNYRALRVPSTSSSAAAPEPPVTTTANTSAETNTIPQDRTTKIKSLRERMREAEEQLQRMRQEMEATQKEREETENN